MPNRSIKGYKWATHGAIARPTTTKPRARASSTRSRREPVSGAPLRIHVLALEDCAPIVPIGTIDLLRKSIDLATQSRAKGSPARGKDIVVSLVSSTTSRTLKAAGNVTLECDATIADAGRCDLVFVPALDPDVVEHLERNRAVLPWLRRAFARGADVVSACTGAFVLAEAGLLDGRTATTHWAFQELFTARHPAVKLAPQAIIVDQGRVITAGGATSFINLVMFLVERIFGEEIAWAASRIFLVDRNKSPQSAYSFAALSSQKDHEDEPILAAQQLIEAEVAAAPSIDDLARRVALSRRTFVRRFRSATGNTPRDYIQRVRVESAKRALERGENVSIVATGVGYEDVVAFRKIFARVTGLTPAEYRSRYGPKSTPAWAPAKSPRRA